MIVLIGWPAAGCGQSTVKVELPPEGRRLDVAEAELAAIRADPLAFLRKSLAATRQVPRFTTLFQRQERLGLLAELKPVENIRAEYRDTPFSVRFTWLDDDSEYLQCVYIEGRNDNKVLLLQRRGLFGARPKPQPWDPQLSVVFAKSRNPITDFGPRRMMERTIDRIEKAQKVGEVSIRVEGVIPVGPAAEPCFAVELRYPREDPFACKLQDLYIHTQTLLPVGTYLWLPGRPERTDRTLDAMYLYNELDAAQPIDDGTFVIDAVPPEEPAKPAEPAPAGKRARTSSPAGRQPDSTQHEEQQKHE